MHLERLIFRRGLSHSASARYGVEKPVRAQKRTVPAPVINLCGARVEADA